MPGLRLGLGLGAGAVNPTSSDALTIAGELVLINSATVEMR